MDRMDNCYDKYERIWNISHQKQFFNTFNIHSLIAVQVMTYIWMISHQSNDQPPKLSLTAWHSNKSNQQVSQTLNKKSIIKCLHIMLPDEMTKVKQIENKIIGEFETKIVETEKVLLGHCYKLYGWKSVLVSHQQTPAPVVNATQPAEKRCSNSPKVSY